MKIDITKLVETQKAVNEKVLEKAYEAPGADSFALAFNVELFEYFNAIGVWKWWKHSHELDRAKILDELADCFAFFLSIVDLQAVNMVQEGELDKEEDFYNEINHELNEFLGVLDGFREKYDGTDMDILSDLITYVGTDNLSDGVQLEERFAIAIFMSKIIFEDLEWQDLVDAYEKKSSVNIQRQEENY